MINQLNLTSVIKGRSRIVLKGVLFKNSSLIFILPDDPRDRCTDDDSVEKNFSI